MNFLKKIFSFEVISLIIVTSLAIVSLLNNSYFVIHDDQHIARLYLLDMAIKQGDLYPRWVGGLGFNFGYPLFNFYPPLIYYISEFFHLLGFNLLWSLKLMIIMGSFISSIGMYLLGKRFFNKRTGLIAATLLLFFFYRIITIYIRGAWAEFFAMSLLPFVFLGLDSLYKSNKFKPSYLFSISLNLLILAHPLIAFPTFFFLTLFFIYYFIKSENRFLFIKNFLLGLFLGLSLSAFFWFPSFIERKYTLVDTILTHALASYKLHFIYPFQLWFSPWGYGGSIAGPNDGISFQLGKIHIFLMIFSIVTFLIYFFSKRKKESSSLYVFLVILLLFSLFMSITYSQFIWDKITYLWYLQFPWRFSTFSGIFLSLIGGAGIYYVEKIVSIPSKLKKIFINIITVIFLGIIVYKYIPYSKPYAPRIYDEAFFTSFDEVSWRVSNTSFEFSPKGIKTSTTKLGTTSIGLEKKDVTQKSFEIIKKDKEIVKVDVLMNAFIKKEFSIKAQNQFEFRLNTFNFPGWIAILDGKEININDRNDYKLITVFVPAGKHSLTFIFNSTLSRTIGNLVSLSSIMILIISYCWTKQQEKLAKKI